MTRHYITMEVEIAINIPDDSDAISRAVGLSKEDADELGFRPGLTEEELLEDLARHCIWGRSDASYCDGWADRPRGEITMDISNVSLLW